MLKRIKNLGKKLNRKERSASFGLVDKPFTRALLGRTVHLTDQAESDLKIMIGGKMKPIIQDITLNDFASSGAVIIAYHIATESMKNLGLKDIYSELLYNNPLPKHSSIVCCFSIFILHGVLFELKQEGLQLNFQNLLARLISAFSVFHIDEIRTKFGNDSIQMFKAIIQSDDEEFKTWHEHLQKILQIYIFQWISSNEELLKEDYVPLFGGMLSSLLESCK